MDFRIAVRHLWHRIWGHRQLSGARRPHRTGGRRVNTSHRVGEQRMENDRDVLPLDDICIAKIAQADQMARDVVRECQAAINGMLSYYLAVNKLDGNWKLAENRKELIYDKTPTPNRP